MEGPPLICRQSVDDEDVQGLAYGVNDVSGGSFSRTFLEPNVHDVMSMELAHHDMSGYLDPRSFGGGSLGFDDYSGSSSLYDVNTSFGDEVSSEQKCLFSNDSAPFAQVSSNMHLKSGRTEPHVSPVTNNKYESTVRNEQSRNVPTYPVKTANPSTCTQYAPVRTLINSSIKSHGSSSTRRTASRNTQKKEAIDPKRVEDEVARNVSQILSATKQQRLAMEAQQRTGTVAPQQPRIVYACPDCHKTVTSARNLQRHRQTCPARNGSNYTTAGIPSSSIPPSSGTMCQTSTSVVLSPTSSYSNLSFSNYNLSADEQNCADWSRSNSYSAPQSVSSQHERCINEPAEQLGTLDPTSISCRLEDACIHPLSLDMDEPRALSSRGSTSSASTGTHSSGAPFVCEACKKSVSSLRSLKRHHTTCKQYIAENGPPPESEKHSSSSINGDLRTLAVVNSSASSIAKPSRCILSENSRHVVTVTFDRDLRQSHPCMKAPQLPVVTSSSCRCSLFDCDCTPSTSPEQFVSCTPKLTSNNNTCEDCNRQLCSASNLKRHRATCKIVMQKQYSRNDGVVSPITKPAQHQKWQSVEIAARERMIIDRSYAAALAASQKAQQQVSQQSQMSARVNSENSGTFVIVQDQGIVGDRPWITVGEHLRAQHMQQKVLEAQNLQSQGSAVSSAVLVSDNCETEEVSKLATNNEVDLEESNHDDNLNMEDEKLKESSQSIDSKSSASSYKCTNIISRLPMSNPSSTLMRCSSSVEQKLIHDVKSNAGTGLQSNPSSSAPHITPLESIITTRPLPSERLGTSFGTPREVGEHRSLYSTLTSISTAEPAAMMSPNRQQNLLTSEFQCPECMKTYSCRKNVKRHRMAVHKLSPEEVSRSMSATHSVGNAGDTATFSQLGQHLSNRLSSTRNDLRFDSSQQLQNNRYQERMGRSWMNSHQVHQSQMETSWSRSREYLDDEESAETARIAAELKRSVEQEMAEIEGKKPRTELAEADTTFHEETELGCPNSHDPAGVQSGSTFTGQINSSIPADSSMKWIDHKTVSQEAAHTSRSDSSTSVRTSKRPPHVCVDCNRVLSSDYSLRRHRLTCVEVRSNSAAQASASSGCVSTHSSSFGDDAVHLQDVMLGSAYIESDRNTDSIGLSDPMLSHVALSTPLPQQSVQFSRTACLSGSGTASDTWFERHSLCKTDDVPDSTTSQRLDRSTSPGLLSTASENAQLGCLQYTRKQTNFGGGSARNDLSCPQQHKHLCQACGKFYSSEWNLERHRRESCPVKGKVSPMQDVTESISDEASVQVGHTLFLLSRSALSRASAYFAQLFAMHDPSKGELRLELDPMHFQSLLDVYNNPNNLNQFNIDAVVVLASRLKFNTVFDSCERYIAEQLPQISVMHAIRLAEQLKLSAIKQRLFDTISIDVFRSLASDEQYKKMDAELKAELLEKWGTFL